MTLKIRGLQAFYGASQALFGVDIEMPAGSITALLGRNGMGKSTTINSIMGLVDDRRGHIEFNGKSIVSATSFEIAQLGVGLVPEGRRIFPNLTVEENLIATAANRAHRSDPWTLDKVLSIFPSLRDRMKNSGWQLSGGEQQMLAIGRALMTNPELLILDEATEGLAPLMREQIWQCLSLLKSYRQSILVVDKNIDRLIPLAQQHYVLEKGRVVWTGTSQQLKEDPTVSERYLGL
jgi:branched-chain amino acid transport system ATP-binding protein